jgi:hypothetical protein
LKAVAMSVVAAIAFLGSNMTNPAMFLYGWVGHVYAQSKVQGPWHKGVCFYLLPSFGDAFYTKTARRPRQMPGQFPIALKLFTKTFLVGSINRV